MGIFHKISTTFKAMFFKLIVLLCLTQIVIAIGMLLGEEYFKYLLIQHILHADQSQSYMILLLAQSYALQLLVLYYCAIPVASKCNQDFYTPHLAQLLKLWIIIGFTCCLQGLFFAFILHRTSNDLSSNLEYNLLSGLEEYYSNPEWRLIWDKMQYHERCCGVFDYSDWKNRYMSKLGQEEQ